MARVGVRPEPDRTVSTSADAHPEPPLDRLDRRVLVGAILEVAASTHPVGAALSARLARHETPRGVALAARLGAYPIESLGRWLADEQNEALRLALDEAMSGTDDPATLRARLPKAIRCWIPRLQGRRTQQPLRVVAGGPHTVLLDG
jgi:hypothetical protein